MAYVEDSISSNDHGKGGSKLEQTSDILGEWSATQVLTIALCFIVNMIDGMDILLFSFVAPTLQLEWGIGADSLGIIFSVAIIGMAVGGMVIAPLADYIGRRWIIIGALTTSSLAMFLSGFASDLTHLMILRFAVGLGIGSVLASMAALVAEYAPAKHRNFAIGLLYAGYPLGAIITGFVAAVAIPALGWQATLMWAGIVSTCMIPFLIFLLPESIQFLTKRRPKNGLAKLNTIRKRMGHEPLNQFPVIEEAFSRPGVAGLFADGRAMNTLLLWCAMIFGFAALWFVISWIPRLAIMSGLDSTRAIYAGTAFNAGAFIGTVSLGLITAKLRLQPTVMVFLSSAALMMIIFGAFQFGVLAVFFISFLIGCLLQGGFNGIYPLAAQLYPAEVRSTGIGWTMGVGRVGAVVGPFLGGILIEQGLPLSVIFTVFAVPAFLGGICAMLVKIQSTHTA